MTNAKDFLKGYYLAKRREQLLQREYDILRASMADIRATDFSKVIVDGSMDRDRIGALIAQLEDKAMKVVKARIKAHSELVKIMGVVLQVEDPTIQEILVSRYIELRKWEDIEEDMFYTERHLHNLKNKGYEEVGKILEGESDA